MSVSSRDRKSVIYGEVERLRYLLDLREIQTITQAETIRRLEAKVEELSASRPAPQPSAAPRSERSSRIPLMKRLAIVCKASIKWVDGQGFRQYKDGNWVAVPTHTVEFAAKGIGQ